MLLVLCSGSQRRVNADAQPQASCREKWTEAPLKLLFDALLFFLLWHTALFVLLPPKKQPSVSSVTPSGQEVALTAGSVNLSPLHITAGRICLCALRSTRMNSQDFWGHLSVCRVCEFITEAPVVWNQTSWFLSGHCGCLRVRWCGAIPVRVWVKSQTSESLFHLSFTV